MVLDGEEFFSPRSKSVGGGLMVISDCTAFSISYNRTREWVDSVEETGKTPDSPRLPYKIVYVKYPDVSRVMKGAYAANSTSAFTCWVLAFPYWYRARNSTFVYYPSVWKKFSRKLSGKYFGWMHYPYWEKNIPKKEKRKLNIHLGKITDPDIEVPDVVLLERCWDQKEFGKEVWLLTEKAFNMKKEYSG